MSKFSVWLEDLFMVFPVTKEAFSQTSTRLILPLPAVSCAQLIVEARIQI